MTIVFSSIGYKDLQILKMADFIGNIIFWRENFTTPGTNFFSPDSVQRQENLNVGIGFLPFQLFSRKKLLEIIRLFSLNIEFVLNF